MAKKIAEQWIHLGLGATATPEPPFTDMSWYQDYAARHEADGREGRLVAMFTFDSSWTSWEVHPEGAEVVLCTAGRITLIQEQPGGEHTRVTLEPGEYAINPPGVWHTADVEDSATAVFITAGQGTQHRSRE
ncbi:cupin domain-containing protein [Pseudenhygromyxa sp. WMMC2535]|uniref:cupin domain-containing protein n=1 Tax=Pseudenhygromyxa sp. WMMC2535 TaxID=2712867 RepID=UPI001555CCCC|nr:cupin domain-containing protein [Pseudenhygromyxa sp. WMMC2535]NVB40658.1 cupin domain-containing protein [Pseudenhygromyxa sp. WMMC2535]